MQGWAGRLSLSLLPLEQQTSAPALPLSESKERLLKRWDLDGEGRKKIFGRALLPGN